MNRTTGIIPKIAGKIKASFGRVMQIMALIDQPMVIEKILTHLGLLPSPCHGPPISAVA